ncbi:hypothetical protein [Clostridium sp. AM58-1XD]|uniref:hypothetical protein n=1 Tax=Clostridium sp. AM58-1XD TaxID=2292307 RepID=UPI000E4ADEEC|nr:hypothetical protein [Clostridium sp. AM58-1XD]RGY97495.1 hypothetical protein DXA13_14440 [Clostridium sp. AM58-1XD]
MIKDKRYILPAAFVLCLYVNAGLLLASMKHPMFFAAGIGINIILGLANCVMAFVWCRQKNEEFLMDSMMIMKYGIMPFFIVYFLIAFVLGLVMVFIAGLIPAMLFMWIDYCILFVGTMYAVSYMIAMVRSGRMTALAAVWHALLQFVFVLDVADTVYLTAWKRRRGRKALAVSMSVSALILILFFLSSTARPA